MDLSQLAALLRENGDQVLNGLSKLSLSTKLLKDLNESFGLVVEEREALSSTFQVISTSNSKVELLLDLQFLHDFVQRTVGLKLIQDNDGNCDLISINKFKNLKLLELRKVPINQIVGLQALRNQLQYIICVRCLLNLKDLFISCGGDESQAFIWSELKEAVLSYNNLETIDNSFEYVPWLQTLDISHNSIVNAQAIDCLPNLKHLNLGFNHLENVPIFKKELFRNLQILILKSNYIGDLTGLLYLDNLVTLDLSCNCLVDHQTLSPIAQLAALQWLNLEGNPLSFHPNHRHITAKYLHSNTATVKFVLDRVFLSKIELKLIGTYYPSSKFSGQFRREHQISISSNISELTNSSDITQVTQVPASELTRSLTQRSKKVRTAVISETDEKADVRDEQGDIVNSEMIKSINSVASLNIPNDHVETQKKIESLRDEYGEEWLKGKGGSIMQDILGIEKAESPRLSSTPYEQDFMIHAADIFKKPIENVANAVSAIVTDSDKMDVISEISANNTFVTASESFDTEDTENELEVKSSSDEDYDEEDEEERPFLAQVHRKNHEPEEIFIVLTNKYIKERDCLTAKIRAKWLLEVISSCEIISKDPTTVCLEFDTVRRNMQQREYVLEEKEAQKFHREISNIISEKPMSALNQTIYRCVKCSTLFSRDKNFSFKDADNPNNLPICPFPNCRSTIVYELDEESTPTNHSVLHQNNNGFKSIERPESPSECSIASETESNPVAQIHVIAEVHTNSKASAVTANRSATSVQESSTSSHISVDDNQISENNFKKYESDIEVISNPSQSSIEVLDDNMRNRKRSSEERRTMIVPTLGTISDVSTHAPLQGLTESSSSSSFTESVCTAYDTQVHISRPSSGLEMKHPIQEEPTVTNDKKLPLKEEKKEAGKNKTNIITSLFEGFFSGPTVGTKSEKTHNQNDIKFEYKENFSNIDHRIKYHLYQNIFEDEHEHFVWLLKCILVSINNQPINGCIVLSTHKVYILHIKDYKPSDELSAWLVKKESFTIDRLQTVYTLPWKQGIGLEIRGAAKKSQNHLCLLQDMQRTSNFLAFLADNPLPDSCDLVCVPPERPMLNLQQLLISQYTNATPKDSTLCLLSVFNKCTIANSDSSKLNLGVFLITKTDLILLNDIFWLLPDAEKEPKIFASQPISNLLEVDIEDMSLDFHFLDEIAGCEEVWSITFETVESLNTAISAVKSPWEEIFLVQLQVNHKIHSA